MDKYNLIGKSVFHSNLGRGKIIEIETYIVVKFESKTIKMQYPLSFEQFLKIEDVSLYHIIHKDLLNCKESKSYATNKRIEEINQKRAEELQKKIEEKEKIRIKKEKELKAKRELELWKEKRAKEEIERKNLRIATLKMKEDIISSRNLPQLVHFTRLENLKNILIHGLVPIKSQTDKKISSIHNDNERYDHNLNASSLSITFPNYKLFSKFRFYQYPNTNWVVLSFDINLLLSENNPQKYYKNNAAKVNRNETTLNELFEEEYITEGGKIIYRKDLSIPKIVTTNPQAEILIENIIDKKYIKSIFFDKSEVMEKFIEENNEILNKLNLKISVCHDYFKHRIDEEIWKGIS